MHRESGLNNDTTDVLSHYFNFSGDDILPQEKADLINQLANTLRTTPDISNVLSDETKRNRLIHRIAKNTIMNEKRWRRLR